MLLTLMKWLKELIAEVKESLANQNNSTYDLHRLKSVNYAPQKGEEP